MQLLKIWDLKEFSLKLHSKPEKGTDLDSVSLPGLGPEEEERDAGKDAGEQAAEQAGLAQVLGVPVDQAGGAAGAAQAWKRGT